MSNPVLHQKSDPEEYEGMDWDRAADAVEQHLQIDGGKSTNKSAPVPISMYGFAEPMAIVNDLVARQILPKKFLAKHP